MSTLSLLSTLLLSSLLLLSHNPLQIFAQSNPCAAVPFYNAGTADITSLAHDSHYQVDLAGGNRFLFNLCKDLTQRCENQPSKSIEAFSGGECYRMSASGPGDIKFQVLDETTTLMTYSGGQKFHSTYTLGTEIALVCDPTIVGPPKLKYTGEKGPTTDNLMLTTVEMRSSQICPSGGGRPLLWPFGFFGLFMFLAAIGVVLYFIIGFIVQIIRKKRGAEISKLELIPNFKIWKELIKLEWEGVLFVKETIVLIINKIRRRGSPEGLHGLENY